MENMELDAMLVIEKLTRKISEDAKTIAMLEVTMDVYANHIKELQKQLSLTQELNND